MTEEGHPAQGMIRLFRTTGNMNLFGSHVEDHHDYVSLEIRGAVRTHDLGSDSYFPTDHIVRVSMSWDQWARLPISLGAGQGVPCTIQRCRTGPCEGVDRLPKQKSEQQQIIDDFEERHREELTKLKEVEREVKEELDSLRISKKARKLIDAALIRYSVACSLSSSFSLRLFNESVSRRIRAAEAEIRAFIGQNPKRAVTDQVQPELIDD